MPTGVGATTVQNDPSVQNVRFVVDAEAFFDLTERNVYTPISFTTPGSGATEVKQLPQAGILSMVRIMFEGTLTVTTSTGTVTSRPRWPYGLLDRFILSANAQNDVYNVAGEDLETLRRIRSANNLGDNTVDEYPSSGIGGGLTITDGANDVVLTWEAPIAIDPTTLIGSIYAQSAAMNLQASIREAVHTDLIEITGAATIDSLTGTWHIEVETFDIPIVGGGEEGGSRLVVPDITRLHVVQAFDTAFTNTGDVPVNLVRGNGQLDRLLVSTIPDNPASVAAAGSYLDPSADANELDAVRIEYGNSQRPLDYNPAHFLAIKNAEAYGRGLLPYGNVAFDFLAENPPRDIIQMAGVTDLKTVQTVNSAVTVNSGARVRTVQEMLIG